MLVRSGRRVMPHCLYEPMKRNKAVKGKARRAWDYLTPSISHLPLCMCTCLCNLTSSPIDIQYKHNNSQALQQPLVPTIPVHGTQTPVTWYDKCIVASPKSVSLIVVRIFFLLVLNVRRMFWTMNMRRKVTANYKWTSWSWRRHELSNWSF